MLTLTPGAATLAQLETIWREGLAVRLDDAARPGIAASAARAALISMAGLSCRHSWMCTHIWTRGISGRASPIRMGPFKVHFKRWDETGPRIGVPRMSGPGWISH